MSMHQLINEPSASILANDSNSFCQGCDSASAERKRLPAMPSASILAVGIFADCKITN